MPSYETLDLIADAYIPLLAVISVAFILVPVRHMRWRDMARRLFAFALLGVIAYGLMFLDVRLQIWPRVGLDYSTHTAVALVLVIFLSVVGLRLWWLWLLSFLSYLLLMLYQEYHTVADMATTIAAVIIPASVVVGYLGERWRFGKIKSTQ